MEFKRENPDCKFTLPDAITVRQQLAYFSAAGALSGNEMWLRLWEAAKTLIQDWECPLIQNLNPDRSKKEIDYLDSADPQVTYILIWVAGEVREHINSLKSLSKNS